MATLTSTSPSEENVPTATKANGSEASGNTTGFSIDMLAKHFQDCLDPATGTLDMDAYIRGYEEIYKFLNLLGTVFGWVATDVTVRSIVIDPGISLAPIDARLRSVSAVETPAPSRAPHVEAASMNTEGSALHRNAR